MQTLFIGQSAQHFVSCESTNLLLKEMAEREEVSEGAWITADFQTAGKGQGDHEWVSPPGVNLLGSVLLRPVWLPAEKSFWLNMAVSLGMRECVEEWTREEVMIKWPNDILVGDRKIAGLLIENVFRGSQWRYAVCGIGMNVQQTDFSGIPQATSVKALTGKEIAVEDVGRSLCGYIEKYYLQLRRGHYHFLEKAYTKSLWRYQHTSAFEIGGKTCEGEIEGVDARGRLGIRIQGRMAYYAHGSFAYIR